MAETPQVAPLGPGRYHHRHTGDVLHPEREPLATLDEMRRSMGSLDFAAQYQQEPVAPGGNLIQWSWFRTYDERPVLGPGDKIIVSWDTAVSASELADYSACVILQVKNGSAYVLEVIRERLEFPALRRRVVEVHRHVSGTVRDYALLIENKGSGMSLVQDLRRDGVHAIAVDPSGDKVMRMNAQTARIEAGSVVLPRRAPWLDEFRREVMAFPAGRYDDQVDALSQGLQRAFDYRPLVARTGTFHYG
jgi:predicted phage terminase large subunit-like protein